MSNKGIEAMRARRAELKEAGVKIERLDPIARARRDPSSKKKAVQAYWWDMSGCASNAASHAMKAEYKACCLAAQGRYRPAIDALCFACVGGYADPGPRERVRDCRCTDCPLHPVRPWRKILGRKSLKTRDESK